MTEFENVHDALEHLILINESKIHRIIENGIEREGTIQDLKDENKETLYNLADLLGMTDLYC